jgi:hypothetical protein
LLELMARANDSDCRGKAAEILVLDKFCNLHQASVFGFL